MIAEADAVPEAVSSLAVAGVQYFQRVPFAGTVAASRARAFANDAGESVDFVHACNGLPSGRLVSDRDMAAIFTPAP